MDVLQSLCEELELTEYDAEELERESVFVARTAEAYTIEALTAMSDWKEVY